MRVYIGDIVSDPETLASRLNEAEAKAGSGRKWWIEWLNPYRAMANPYMGQQLYQAQANNIVR